MEEKINGKTYTVIDASQMTDIGVKLPVTFTVNGKRHRAILYGRITQKCTEEIKE